MYKYKKGKIIEKAALDDTVEYDLLDIVNPKPEPMTLYVRASGNLIGKGYYLPLPLIQYHYEIAMDDTGSLVLLLVRDKE